MKHGVAAGVEHAPVLGSLGHMATVVDIGANRGQFALAAKHAWPDACLIAFEPLREPAGVFRTIFSGAPDVHLHEAAVGPARSRSAMHLSARDDSSSLLPITDRQSELFDGTAETGTLVIEVGPLDTYVDATQIAEPALLKIDVQGYELQALEGCGSLIGCFSWAYVECSFVELYAGQAFADEVIAWLRERGFSLRGVYNMSYDERGVAIQADFLFGRG